MPLVPPSKAALRSFASTAGLDLTDEEVDQMLIIAADFLQACERLDRLVDDKPAVACSRARAYKPAGSDNPYNGWQWRCSIKATNVGPLAGKRIVLKDTIPVAGLPMSVGSAILDGHVSDIDATVVRRVLEAGGEIVGIATTEDLCLSASSISSYGGIVHNPLDQTRTTGGSSSGVAALIAAGDCDMGIGADQGGSIRVPSALCGIVGLKPTYGLVPYTGCAPIDVSCDHLGPMARSAADVALLLEVIAGPDGEDPRQTASGYHPPFRVGLEQGLTGLTIGVVTEGFAEGADPDVIRDVRRAIDVLSEAGAKVREVSIPGHRNAVDIHGAILWQGASEFMIRGHGMGMPGKGYYNVGFGQAVARGWRLQADQVFTTVKFAAVVGHYVWNTFGGRYYGKAQNLARLLRGEYDRAFESCDLLVMPTCLIRAPELPKRRPAISEAFNAAGDPMLIANTCAFNHTGHPAISVPVQVRDQLPAAMMFIAPYWHESELIRVAQGYERATDLDPSVCNG